MLDLDTFGALVAVTAGGATVAAAVALDIDADTGTEGKGNGVTDAALLALLDTAGTKVGDTGCNVAKGVPDTDLGESLAIEGLGGKAVGAALDVEADADANLDASTNDGSLLGSAVAVPTTGGKEAKGVPDTDLGESLAIEGLGGKAVEATLDVVGPNVGTDPILDAFSNSASRVSIFTCAVAMALDL